ncbi:putative membrane protein YkvI [Heliophilum fasciatum]|uniref:Putative membrane protein YkvI n=2 Tax=Heliophilum fasciatum TaxID=35700 RepID=A0A4R2RNK3_9FIRM|nr:putative membrane protein YkvI [Heliophilum fasciatum]
MKMRWQLQVASVYVGAVLGAGFASGQEILQFFVRYGWEGLQASWLSMVLFVLMGPAILWVCYCQGISRYPDLLTLLFGKRGGQLMDVITGLALMVGVVVMLSGTGALVAQQWDWPMWSGVLVTGCCLLLALWSGLRGLVWVNTLLVPVKAIICVTVALAVVYWLPDIGSGNQEVLEGYGLAAVWNNPESTSGNGPIGLLPPSPYLAAFLYVSFNIAMSFVVLVALSPAVTLQGGYGGAGWGGAVLGIVVYLLTFAMLPYWPVIEIYPVPMLHLAGALGTWIGELYAFLLWLAMFTAALSNAFGVAQRLAGQEEGRKYQWALVAAVVGSMPFALLPFASLVANVYPLFGYMGIPLLVAILGRALWEGGHRWRR